MQSSNNLQIIGDTLRSPQTLNRMALALSLDVTNDSHKKIIHEYASSVLMEIEKTAGDNKKDLTACLPSSIVECMIDSAKFKIKIDGRQHAHLVKFGQKVTLQIGYRGFIAKIKEAMPTSDINAFPVFEGDELIVSSENGFDTYSHKRGNPFASEKDLTGVVGVIYYKKEGREFQRVVAMSKEEVNKIRGVAKQTFIWDKWFIEKAKVAVIKRMCKMTFAEISAIQEIIDYDNKAHFDLSEEKPKINDLAQVDEFTQKALADKTNDLESEKSPDLKDKIKKIEDDFRRADTIETLDSEWNDNQEDLFEIKEHQTKEFDRLDALYVELRDGLEKKEGA